MIKRNYQKWKYRNEKETKYMKTPVITHGDIGRK
jgi:hypothetical protein